MQTRSGVALALVLAVAVGAEIDYVVLEKEGQRFIQRFSHCFTDLRNPRFVEHGVYELVCQRTYGLCF